MGWLEQLADGAALPSAFSEWARSQPDRRTAWQACGRPDWQLLLAAHAPGLSDGDRRTVIHTALQVLDDDVISYLYFVRPWLTRRDVLGAWSRPPASRFNSRQKLAAGNHAFLLALIAAVVIDRNIGAALGAGTTRAMFQAALVFAGWALLTLPFRLLRKRLLDGAVSCRSFDDVVAEAGALLESRASATEDRAALAQRLRDRLRHSADVHFA